MAYKEMLEYWEKEGITPIQQVVVCAAILVKLNEQYKEGYVTLCGARHWDEVMRLQAKVMSLVKKDLVGAEQGFIDQFGTFLTREEAMILVKKSGQPFDIDRNGGSMKTLYSEGLY